MNAGGTLAIVKGDSLSGRAGLWISSGAAESLGRVGEHL